MSCNCGKCNKNCPTITSGDCKNLKRITPLMIDDHITSAGGLDECSPSFCKDVLQWAVNQAKNTSCILKNFANQICGLWSAVKNLYDNDKILQQEIICLSNAIKDLYRGNVKTSFNVRASDGSLPGGSQGGTFNPDGSFTLFNDEVVPTAGIRTTITGKVNFTSHTDSTGIVFVITSVYIDKIVGSLINGGYDDLMSTKVVVNGQTVYDSNGQNIPLNQPFIININNTFTLNEEIHAPASGDTGFFDIINLIQQNIIGGSDIDNVWGQIRFENSNSTTPPNCIQDIDSFGEDGYEDSLC